MCSDELREFLGGQCFYNVYNKDELTLSRPVDQNYL